MLGLIDRLIDWQVVGVDSDGGAGSLPNLASSTQQS
jgi:hypothetical protein